jgi:hypothetical protein
VRSRGRVQRLELIRCGLGKPVDHRPLLADEEAIEQARRTRVQQYLGEVFAADKENVVNAKISRDDVVAGWPVWALPFGAERRSTAQTVGGAEERSPIVEGCAKRVSMVTAPMYFA